MRLERTMIDSSVWNIYSVQRQMSFLAAIRIPRAISRPTQSQSLRPGLRCKVDKMLPVKQLFRLHRMHPLVVANVALLEDLEC